MCLWTGTAWDIRARALMHGTVRNIQRHTVPSCRPLGGQKGASRDLQGDKYSEAIAEDGEGQRSVDVEGKQGTVQHPKARGCLPDARSELYMARKVALLQLPESWLSSSDRQDGTMCLWTDTAWDMRARALMHGTLRNIQRHMVPSCRSLGGQKGGFKRSARGQTQ